MPQMRCADFSVTSTASGVWVKFIFPDALTLRTLRKWNYPVFLHALERGSHSNGGPLFEYVHELVHA